MVDLRPSIHTHESECFIIPLIHDWSRESREKNANFLGREIIAFLQVANDKNWTNPAVIKTAIMRIYTKTAKTFSTQTKKYPIKNNID